MNTGNSDLRISETPEEAARQCARYILGELSDALSENGRVSIAISGGSTPKLLFADMARVNFDWDKVHVFWVDERCVPPDDKDSNYRMAKETLLSPAHIPSQNIHRIYGEASPAEASEQYQEEIKSFFQLKEGELPAFDVLHRGMGPDAHTASLFPGSPLVYDQTGIATNVWVEKMKMDRITLLPGVLSAAKRTVLQVAGEEKADALLHVLKGEMDLSKYPCQIASRGDGVVWFLDKAAASKL